MFRATVLLTLASLLAAPVVLPAGSSALADDPVTDRAPLHDFGTTDPPRHGWSTLVRNDEGIAVTVDTKHLLAFTPHTFWIVIFNDPAACSAPCGLDDLGLDSAAVVFGGAVMTDADGKMFVSSGLTKDVEVGLPLRCCFGALTAPFDAEVHIIVREHPVFTLDDLHIHLQVPTPDPPATDVQSSIHLP